MNPFTFIARVVVGVPTAVVSVVAVAAQAVTEATIGPNNCVWRAADGVVSVTDDVGRWVMGKDGK